MELGKTEQRVADLHFFLYRRALHPELFTIYEHRHLDCRRYQADLWIVGLAHVVTVQVGECVVTEVLANENDLLPKRGLAHSFKLRGERDHHQGWTDGLTFILSSQVERMTQHVFAASYRDLERYARRRGLSATYGNAGGADGFSPFSFLDYEAREREFHIHAFHLFPEEQTIVKTQSIVELASRRRRGGNG